MTNKVAIRPPVERPTRETFAPLPAHVAVLPGDVPTLEQLGLSAAPGRAVLGAEHDEWVGGEEEGVKRVKQFCAQWNGQALGSGNGNANGGAMMKKVQLGTDFSCQISPWLSIGCVSARMIYDELKRRCGTANGAVTTTLFELTWRDFFRFVTAKHNMASRAKKRKGRAGVHKVGGGIAKSERVFAGVGAAGVGSGNAINGRAAVVDNGSHIGMRRRRFSRSLVGGGL